MAGEVAGEIGGGKTVGGETVGEPARATFVGDGWVRPGGTGFESFSTIGVGAVTTEATVASGTVGVGAVATEAIVAADAVGGAAVLTGATSPASGSGSAALSRTAREPNEITQIPKIKSPAKSKAPVRDLFRIFSSRFSAPCPRDKARAFAGVYRHRRLTQGRFGSFLRRLACASAVGEAWLLCLTPRLSSLLQVLDIQHHFHAALIALGGLFRHSSRNDVIQSLRQLGIENGRR